MSEAEAPPSTSVVVALVRRRADRRKFPHLHPLSKKRLLDHLTSNSLLDPFQSAYTKFYSAEITLLSLHDHLSNAISMPQISCLCLLDLSAAFDSLDHSILLHRLSTWFGISSVSLQWFASYFSSRTSTVGIPPHSSPSSPLSYLRSSKGSVLAPVLFNLYTTPLSSLISAFSISHLHTLTTHNSSYPLFLKITRLP